MTGITMDIVDAVVVTGTVAVMLMAAAAVVAVDAAVEIRSRKL
jgi:hypothetical protein